MNAPSRPQCVAPSAGLRNTRPLVSVVIPSYNHAPFVGAAMHSVLAQSMADLELLIIDDGSRDGSPEAIARQLERRRDPRVTFLPRPNRGLCRTLNEGLLLACGRYFAYLGSDDLWEPTKLERQIPALEAEGVNAGACFGDCYVIDAQGSRLDRFGRQYCFRGGDIYRDLLLGWFHPASPTNLFVRSKLLCAGGFNEAIPVEDRDTWIRLTRLYRVAYVHEPLASFRVHQANTHTAHPERMMASNEYTHDWALRTDPCLVPLRRRMMGLLRSSLAAIHYQALDMRRARRAAQGALLLNPFDRLAWRIVTRSLLGTHLIGRLRGWRRPLHERSA